MEKHNHGFPSQATSSADYIDYWQGVRTRLIDIIKTTAANDFNTPFPDNSWSVAQIADHLYKSQYQLARLVKPVMKSKLGLDMGLEPAADYLEILKLLSGPGKFKNPDIVAPDESLDQEETVVKLAAAMERMIKVYNEYSVEELRRRGLAHPLYGPLNMLEWLWMLAHHERMHVAALRKKV